MSTLTALARVEAFSTGRAVPIATVRHVHLSDEPLVLVPLLLAGEAAAPLAALVGTARERPELLVVEQPRNRDQRFAFLAALAEIVVGYTDHRRAGTETVEPTARRGSGAWTPRRSSCPTAAESRRCGCSAAPPASVRRRALIRSTRECRCSAAI
jgi:hypothetical protein